MPRKILIITNRIPYPLNDGGNLAMDAMIAGYHSEGWDVYLLAMNTVRHYIKHEVLQGLYRQLFAFEWLDIDNQVRPLPLIRNFLFSKKPEHVERFYHMAFRLKLRHILQTFVPDVVQVESVYLTTYLPEIKEHSGALTVLRVHNIEYHVWHTLSKAIKNPLKRVYFRDLARRIRHYEKRAWGKYDLLLPITEKDCYLIERLANAKAMMVAPFGIKHKDGAAAKIKERWVGYHIGAMDWIPNRDGVKWFLESVWKLVQEALPEFEFYFAGRKMPDIFKTLGLPNVHCMAEVESADDFIADKKILIVPLWSGSGIRVKILEAMAAGKVVVSTVAGIKGIDAKPNEHFLLANEPADFVKALSWCMNNKNEAEAMAQHARIMVTNRYDQGVITRKIIHEIDRLLGN